MTMKLYYCETMNPRKACVTAKYLRSPVEYVRVDLPSGEHKQPEHLRRHPLGRVPALVDGDKTIWESMAIMVYLAVQAGSDLWPARDPEKQAEVVRWLSFDAFEWVPHVGAFYFEHHIKPNLLGQPADPAALEGPTQALQEPAKVLDQQLSRSRFLTGDTLTVADFAVGVLLPLADEIALPLSDHRNIQRWHGELMKLDAWRDPWPAQPPTR